MDIKDIAKEIRTILKNAFPATKFSVTISRFSMGSSADISWTDGPTTEQVDDLVGAYGTPRSRFISTSRKHSSELVNKAIAVWKEQNPEYAHLTVTCKGETSCYAVFDMSEFSGGIFDLRECESSFNSIIYYAAFDGTNLILPQEDADDSEPETVSAPEPEIVEVKPKTIVPVSAHQIKHDIFIEGNFPSQNKQDWIDDYRNQPVKLCQAKIVKIVELTPADYQEFLYSLLDNHEWLEGEGGGGSHYVSEKYGDDYDKLFQDEAETQKWRSKSYTVAVVVTDGKDYILVNPEGYKYARYCGFGTCTTLGGILSIAQIQLSGSIAAPTAIAQPGTNLISFPVKQQLETPTPATEQTTESDGYYLQNYQKWVDKLVARGDYGKIKSFDEWYAILSQVM